MALKADEFIKGIDQARQSLLELQKVADNIVKTISNQLKGGGGTGATKTPDLIPGADKAKANIKTIVDALDKIPEKVKSVSKKAGEAFNIGDAAAKNLQHGLELGLSHAVGAISVGANPLTSLVHELVRNLSISGFHTGLQAFKSLGDAADGVSKNVGAASKAEEEFFAIAANGQPIAGAIFDKLNQVGEKASALGAFFNSLDLSKTAFGIGLLLIGSLLDKIGEKLLSFTEGLARNAGDANLAFTQLDAVLKSTGESMGVNLGTTQQWTSFLRDLAITSGTSRKELAQFATAFVQVGADAGLSGTELQQLVTIAAFTKDRFRNATEELTNFRQALAGNTRFLANNIPIGNTLNDVTEKYIEILQRQGATQEKATQAAKDASTAQKVIVVLNQAAIPFIKTATETTGSYAIELRKLGGAVENLKISLGSGIEPIFAGLTKGLREIITNVTQLPRPLQDLIVGFITIGGAAAELGGKLLKLLGIITLVGVAITALNGALAATEFGSITGLVTTLASRFITVLGPLTSFSEIFLAIRIIVSDYLAKNNLLIAGLNLLKNGIVILFGALKNLIVPFLTLQNLFTVLKFGAIAEAVFILVDAFKEANKEGNVLSSIFGLINAIFAPIIQGLADVTGNFYILTRAMALFNIVGEVTATIFRLIGIGAGILAQKILSARIDSLLSQAEQLRKVGDIAGAAALEQKAVIAQNSLIGIQKGVNALTEDVNRSASAVRLYWDTVTGSGDAIARTINDLKDLRDAMNVTRQLDPKASEEQINIVKRAVKSLRSEVDQLQVKRVTLISGQAAGQQEAALLKLKDLLSDLSDPKKGGGVKLFTNDELDKAKTLKDVYAALGKNLNVDTKSSIENIKSANQIFGVLRKSFPKDLVDSLQKSFNQTESLSASNAQLERELSLFKSILNSISDLDKSLDKQLRTLQASVEAQDKFNEAINVSSTGFDETLRKAQQETEIRKATLKVDSDIAAIRDQINNGKIVAISTTETTRVQLNPQEKAKALADLNSLTAKRQALIEPIVSEAGAKRVTSLIEELQKQFQSLNKSFSDDARSLKDQGDLTDKFIANLSKGTKFAEDQLAIDTKELDLKHKLQDAQNSINDITTVLLDNTNGLNDASIQNLITLRAIKQAELDRLDAQKQNNVEAGKANQLTNDQKTIALFIKTQNNDLSDQLALLEDRAKLFDAGVLQGDFNKSAERVSILTSALENLLKKKEELIRQQNENPTFIGQEAVDDTVAKIKQIEDALKAANFINDIREILQVIPDAINEALTEGVKGVLEGTQKISDLFRNMAQNILLSLSKIFAQRAISKIGEGLDQLAETIAKSDIGRKIAAALGIDLSTIGKLFEKSKSPQEQLKDATIANTNIIRDGLIPAINKLIVALGGTPIGGGGQPPIGGGGPLIPLNNGIPLPTAPGTGPIDFEKIFQQINDGTAKVQEITQQDFTQLWQDITGYVQIGLQNSLPQISNDFSDTFTQLYNGINSDITDLGNNSSGSFGDFFSSLSSSLSEGIKGIGNIGKDAFGNLFSSLGSILQSGLSSLSSGLGSIISGGGSAVSSIFSSIGSGISSFFSFLGFAEGGVLPGTPQKKDNLVIKAASGEGILNTDAVQYYGGKQFIDSLNNLSLPKDFFTGLQTNGAPAQLRDVASKVTTRPVNGGLTNQSSNDQPIIVQVIDRSHKLDPAKFKSTPDEITQIFVQGVKRDRVIRQVIREDLKGSSV